MISKPRPRRELLPTLFIVAFFAALPAWFLSTLEGWIAVDCVRGDAGYACEVHERLAFGERHHTYTTTGARVVTRVQHGRRGTSSKHQLELVTPDGSIQALRDATDDDDLVVVARELDAAISARAPAFHARVDPDATFWVAVALLGVFVAAGLFISRPK